MPPNSHRRRPLARTVVSTLVFIAAVMLFQRPAPTQTVAVPADSETRTDAEFEVVSLSGKVVWLGEALERRNGVQVVPEAVERTLALETDEGDLIPLIEDLRGRAFRLDERLRAMDVELRVRRYRSTPALQILTVYEIRDGVKYEVDYWCDICSIPMFEMGPCACCQQDNRLRKRRVEERAAP